MVYKCSYCSKEYKRHLSFEKHLTTCKYKLRFDNRNQTYVQTAYKLWIKFSYFKDKSIENFEHTSDYTYFTKFTKSCQDKNWQHIYHYGIWLLDNKVQYSHWHKEEYYISFIKYYTVTEHPRDAIIRSIEQIQNLGYYGRFMNTFPIGRGILLVEKGILSPWIFFIFNNSKMFLDRIREDQIEYFGKVINIDVWLNRVKRYSKSVERLQQELKGIDI